MVKELADSIRLVRENFKAGLISYASSVAQSKPDNYKAEIAGAIKAGEPILTKDRANLTKALQAEASKAIDEAQAIVKADKPDADKPAARG